MTESGKVESEMELDIPGLDLEEPHQAGGTHPITGTTKKVAPPPPKRGHASSAATAALAVRYESGGEEGGEGEEGRGGKGLQLFCMHSNYHKIIILQRL